MLIKHVLAIQLLLSTIFLFGMENPLPDKPFQPSSLKALIVKKVFNECISDNTLILNESLHPILSSFNEKISLTSFVECMYAMKSDLLRMPDEHLKKIEKKLWLLLNNNNALMQYDDFEIIAKNEHAVQLLLSCSKGWVKEAVELKKIFQKIQSIRTIKNTFIHNLFFISPEIIHNFFMAQTRFDCSLPWPPSALTTCAEICNIIDQKFAILLLLASYDKNDFTKDIFPEVIKIKDRDDFIISRHEFKRIVTMIAYSGNKELLQFYLEQYGDDYTKLFKNGSIEKIIAALCSRSVPAVYSFLQKQIKADTYDDEWYKQVQSESLLPVFVEWLEAKPSRWDAFGGKTRFAEICLNVSNIIKNILADWDEMSDGSLMGNNHWEYCQFIKALYNIDSLCEIIRQLDCNFFADLIRFREDLERLVPESDEESEEESD